MSKFNQETIKDLANKLLIDVNEEETNMILSEFDIIDATINKINNIENIENIEPMTHTLDDFNYELREDVIEESIPIDELLKNSDVTYARVIEVPKVVG